MKYIKPLLLFLLLSPSVMKSQSFPDFTLTVYDTASNGYYFFAPYKLNRGAPQGIQRQMILDDKGRIVYYKDFNNGFASDFKIQSNGRMSYSYRQKFYLIDSTFIITDSVSTRNGIIPDLHDMQVLPNAHYLLLGVENVIRDLSGYPMFLGNGSPGSSHALVKAGVVQELDMNKNVVFEWHAIDHFNFDDVDENFLVNTDTVDWTHMNAIEQDADGNILVSNRHFNEITKINRSDSSVIWRLGGKQNQFTFIGDSLKFLSQHDIRRISNGHITLFDNGRSANGIHPAAAKEYELDEIGMTATLVWSHLEDSMVYSRSQGNVQRLANSNTLISYGDLSPDNFVFKVVTPAGNKIFEITFPDTLISYRSFNYPSLPWSLSRPVIACLGSTGSFSLTAPAGYSSYSWSTGENSRSIAVTDTGNYYVDVPAGAGGFIRSEVYYVADVNNACLLSSLQVIEPSKSLLIYPNPANDWIIVETLANNFSVDPPVLFDACGRKLNVESEKQDSDTWKFNLQHLSYGIYFIGWEGHWERFVIE